jgi:hypothetical protein
LVVWYAISFDQIGEAQSLVAPTCVESAFDALWLRGQTTKVVREALPELNMILIREEKSEARVSPRGAQQST